MIEVGQVYEAEITGISHQGFGVCRLEQLVVFVPQAMLGERVKIAITEVKKNLAHGVVQEILLASAQRIAPRCPMSAACGGCELQMAQYDYQLLAKRQIVEDALHKLARQDVAIAEVIGMAEPWRYRNKGVFHAAYRAGEVTLGFYQLASHDVVAADGCYLFTTAVNAVLLFLEKAIQKHTKTHYIQKVMIRESRFSGEMMVVFVTQDNNWTAPQLVDELRQAFPQVTSVYHNINTNPKLMLGKSFRLLAGQAFILDTLGDLRFQISPQSFFQVNNTQAEALYNKVLEFADLTGKEQVIDAYCGIGAIALFLARQAHCVYGVETVSQAVKDAGINACLNQITNCRFITAKAEEWLPKWIAQGNYADVIVIDPPRKGCDTRLLYALSACMPAKIIYVSCEPSTMARDVRYLCENGYQVQQVQPVDLFAQSWHVECVCLLSKV